MKPIKLKNIAENIITEFTTKHVAELSSILNYSYEEKIASLWEAIITFTTVGKWMLEYDQLTRFDEFQSMIRDLAIEKLRDDEPDMDEDSEEADTLIASNEEEMYYEYWFSAQNSNAVPKDIPKEIRTFVEENIFREIIMHSGNIDTLDDAADEVRYFAEAIVKSVEDGEPPELNAVFPSWFWLTDPTVERNTWMIHFTGEDNRDQIIKSGFKRGVGDPMFVSWSTGFYDMIPGEDAKNKYHFAYTVDYLLKEPDKFWRYGYSAVMFRASGITMYHYADREMQTVFSSPTAKDFVPIDWLDENNAIVRGGKKTLKKGPLDEVMKWVVANYNQYRKVFSLNVPANEDDEHETN